jgi:hypothetical protein
MLIFTLQSLAFIAVPKTGTMAVRAAIGKKSDIALSGSLRHMTAQRFHLKVVPWLEHAFDLTPDRIAVMREPEDQARSWYKYRCRPQTKGTAKSAVGLSFDEFILACISENPPPFARIGSQSNMLMSNAGDVLVHHLFAYEKMPLFEAFLSKQFGEEIRLEKKNASPAMAAELSPETRAKFRAARARDYDLYDRLQQAGGHLITEVE